ncbi:hypothetical protein AB4Z52_18650 [Rhizobium sp. 2YAF20]|uniref:hypothetical protein n=1 Tax=Rhizobium sp. 2YAF20 TaxID=3233027 RepID=UPI003F94B0A6
MSDRQRAYFIEVIHRPIEDQLPEKIKVLTGSGNKSGPSGIVKNKRMNQIPFTNDTQGGPRR